MNADHSSPAPATEDQADHDSGPGVGALLRASRLRCGEDLRAVAHLLRIRLSYLEAIEDGRFHDLPGATYAIGFVRAYSEHLGLDSEEVIRRFKSETSEISGTTSRLEFPVPVPERGIPGGAVLFVGVVLAVVAYGGWYVSTTKDSFLAELISPIPERLAALLPDKGAPSSGDAVDAGTGTEGTPSPTSATAATPSVGMPPSEEAGAGTEQSAAADQPATEPASEPAPATTAASDQSAVLTPPPSASPAPASDSAATATTTSSEPETPTPAAPNQVAETVAEPAPAAAPSGQDGAPVLPQASETPPPAAEPTAPAARDAAEAAADAAKKAEVPAVAAATSGDSATGTSVTAPATPTPPPPTVAGDQPARPAETEESATAPAATPPPAEESPQVAAVPPSASPSTGGGGATSSETSRAGQVFGAQDEISRILVRAKTNSWIQVRDDNGNQLLLTRLLRAGDSYRVPDRPGLTLLTGNAGALEILVDGETVPSIGPPGAVRRGVLLDIDRLREGTAVTN